MNAPASAADPAQRNLAGRRLGRYEVLTQLASGGMAGVYVARAQGVAGFERLVAVKVLHPHLAHEDEFISMFLDEARLAARIRHPNVVATLDISDTHGDGFFIVMDYIEGDHLGALLQRAARQGQRLPAGVVGRVVIDALQGLAAAHTLTDENGEPLNLVHRDVSPHNVMVGVDGISRLTDFGVAKAEVRLTSTREGQFKGKLAYMAPEQASTGNADQRSDLFSMGVILWESLTGRRLFRGENNAETLHKVLQSEIPPPSSLWPELEPFDDVVLKALQRDENERFQAAEDFAEALELAAREAGGLGTSRAVGDVVRTYVGEKLQQERDRVKGAIEFLGRTDVSEAAMPLPRDGSQSLSSMPSLTGSLSSISASGRRPVEGEHNTLAARPGTMSQQMPLEQGRSNKAVLALGALVLLLLGAVAAFAVVFLGDRDSGSSDPMTPATELPGDPGGTGTAALADEPAPEESDEADGADDATEAAETAEADEDEAPLAAAEAAEQAQEEADEKADEEAIEEESTQRSAAAHRARQRQQQRRRAARQAASETEEAKAEEASEPEPKPAPRPKRKPKPQPKADDDDDAPIFNPYR